MKIILKSKQVPEIAHLCHRDRRAIIRRYHWKSLTHWQGWVGFAFYIAAMFFAILEPEIVIPESLPFLIRLALRMALFCLLSAIYLTLYYDAIRPHIRKEIEFWIGMGFLEKQKNKTANHGLESTSAPPAAGTLETHP